jgi:hypothetical protein
MFEVSRRSTGRVSVARPTGRAFTQETTVLERSRWLI